MRSLYLHTHLTVLILLLSVFYLPLYFSEVVSNQFEDMTQTFRHKAQKFAEQLVTEVFAAREGSVPAEPAGEPPSLPEELKARSSVSPDSTAMPPPATLAQEAMSPTTQEPQAYRDESRVSEFGKYSHRDNVFHYSAIFHINT